MNTTRIENVSRRRFLQGAAGLTLAFHLPGARSAAAAGAPLFEPNAFVRIDADNVVTVISKHLEMGQGTYTGLATIVAEELDAAWSQVRIEGAPADARRYARLPGQVQLTGGSRSIASSWEQLRNAGASARAMLVAAAARQWKVPAEEIGVREGVVMHSRSQRKASFGQLATAAAQQPVPTESGSRIPGNSGLSASGRRARIRPTMPTKMRTRRIWNRRISGNTQSPRST
jgi:isoquinoline 1-oxidoreductase subunit beta